MDITFGETLRRADAPNSIGELNASIVREIPGLNSHLDGLEMRYVDDEGDELTVATDDELQEALRVGKESANGILLLRLTLPGIDKTKICEIEQTARGVAASKVSESPAAATAVTEDAPSNPDILQLMKNAGATAVAEINTAMVSASNEIEKLFNELGTVTSKQKDLEKQLAAAAVEVAEATSKCNAAEQQVSNLEDQLSSTQAQLAKSVEQNKHDVARLQELEVQVAEAETWENKFKREEKERLIFQQKLRALEDGLRALNGGLSTAATAEVISTEAVPPSPVLEPVPSPEQPPPYEEPTIVSRHHHSHSLLTPVDTATTTTTTTSTIRADNQFPGDCPAPTPLQLNMQHLRDMGFELTYEQLTEKMVQHGDNMQHVIHDLLNK